MLVMERSFGWVYRCRHGWCGDIDSRSELTVIALGVSLQNVGMDYLSSMIVQEQCTGFQELKPLPLSLRKVP